MSVSLDSLDDEVFRAMNDVDFPVARVLDGIEAAQRVGLAPIKINIVVKRGVNDHTIVDLVRRFQGTGSDRALDRVYGRRHDERLAAR